MKGDHGAPKELKKLKVSKVLEKKGGYVNPVIVTFQNGELNQRNASKCNVFFTANVNGETNIEVQSPAGHVFKDAQTSEKARPKQVIAIRNKKTKKVKLVEVDHAVLINSALMTTPEKRVVPEDVTKKVKTLNRAFGSKKVVNRLVEREKLNLSSTPIVEDVKKAVEDISVEGNVSIDVSETDSILNLLPPCNRDAKALPDVYRLSEILTAVELDVLKEEVSKNPETFTSNDFSPFVLNCYSEVKDSKEKLEKLAVLLFIEMLIRFAKLPSKKLSVKSLRLCPFSTIIHDKIVDEFCHKTETSLTRPMKMRDKALCYIIALTLISCEYTINLKQLATSTATHFTRLVRLAQVTGAVPTPREGYFTLKVPLPALPKTSKKRKLKRG